MDSECPLVLRVLANAACVVERAAVIVREVLSSGKLDLVDKTGLFNPQTKADRTSQDCIVNSLRATFPGITVIGEEGEQVVSAPDKLPEGMIIRDLNPDVLAMKTPERLTNVSLDRITVWVDPLDGTREYVEGLLDCVTILIGIAVDGESVAGVIGQPFFEGSSRTRTIAGLVGAGTVGLDQKHAPEWQRIITTTRSRGTPLVREGVEAVKPTKVEYIGGAGAKVLMLLDGRAHAYVNASSNSKKWDSCGPEAVLRAAGGSFTDVRGIAYRYDSDVTVNNEHGTLATAVADEHKGYLDLIPQHVKDEVKDYYEKRGIVSVYNPVTNE